MRVVHRPHPSRVFSEWIYLYIVDVTGVYRFAFVKREPVSKSHPPVTPLYGTCIFYFINACVHTLALSTMDLPLSCTFTYKLEVVFFIVVLHRGAGVTG